MAALPHNLSKPQGLSPEHIRIARIAESILSEPEKDFTDRFEELLQLSASKDHVRDQALLTAALVLSDVLPQYRLGHDPDAPAKAQAYSKTYKSQQVYEEKLIKAVKTLVSKLKTRGLVRGMGLLLETGSPLVLGGCGEQLVDALVGAGLKGSKEACEILEKFVKSDVDLDLSVKVVRSITRQKIANLPSELISVLEKVKTDQGLKHGSGDSHGEVEDEELKRDLLVSSTNKDIKKIKNNEINILKDIIVFSISHLRSLTGSSSKGSRSSSGEEKEKMISVMRIIRVHGLLVNVELSREIAEELRKVFMSYVDSDNVLFEIFTTLLVLLKNLETVSDAFSTTIYVGKMVARLIDGVANCSVDQLTFLTTELVKLAQEGPLETQEQVTQLLFTCVGVHGEGGRVFASQLFMLFARCKLDLRCELDRGGKFHELLTSLEISADPVMAATLNDLWQFSENPGRAKRRQGGGVDQTNMIKVLKTWIHEHPDTK